MVKSKRELQIDDISLAISMSDIRLLECVFQANAPLEGKTVHQEMLITNPQHRLTLDPGRRVNVLQSTVAIRFSLIEGKGKAANSGSGVSENELVRFGVTVGVVVDAPVFTGDAIAARHLATGASAEELREKNMERAMRVEAIKAAYALAMSKLAEFSSMSPLGLLALPLIDADEILDDMVKRETENK